MRTGGLTDAVRPQRPEVDCGRTARAIGIAVVAMVSLHGCGGTSGSTAPDATTEAGSPPGAPEDAASEPVYGTDEDEQRAALRALLATADLAVGEREALIDRYQTEVQDEIARCMAGLGFDYIPIDLPAGPLESSSDLSPDEFRTQFGFGISTRIDAPSTRSATFVNPNTALLAGMSQAEAKEWDRAMGGCYGEAVAIVEQPAPVALQHDEALSDASARIEARVASHPRVVAAVAAWSACMAERGYAYESLDDPVTDVSRRAGPYLTRFQARQEAAFREGGDPEALRLDEVFDTGEVEDLRSVQRLELAVAADHQACAEEARVEEVRGEVRQDAIEAYADGEDAGSEAG